MERDLEAAVFLRLGDDGSKLVAPHIGLGFLERIHRGVSVTGEQFI